MMVSNNHCEFSSAFSFNIWHALESGETFRDTP